jgi:GntR family transcriptional repressor for pyruvate dehydrogenase complex
MPRNRIALGELSLPVPKDRHETAIKLVEFIRSKQLKAGDRVPSIRQIAAALNISYTSARDALNQAQALGCVTVHPRNGAFVRDIHSASHSRFTQQSYSFAVKSDLDLVYVLDARRFIEPEVAAQAAKRRRFEEMLPARQALGVLDQMVEQQDLAGFLEANIWFHVALATAAGNSVFTSIVESLAATLQPLLLRSVFARSNMQASQNDHKAIYHAVLAGDVFSARTAMHDHLIPTCYNPISLEQFRISQEIIS